MRRIARQVMLSGLLAAATVTPAGTQGVRALVDDRGTTVVSPVLGMRWRSFVRGAAGQAVTGTTRVMIHLATAPWLGRRSRIYMTLARAGDVDVAATWPGGAVLAAGSLVSGGHAVVYDGLVREPALSDTLDLTLTTDGRRLTTPTTLAFSFEIEVLP